MTFKLLTVPMAEITKSECQTPKKIPFDKGVPIVIAWGTVYTVTTKNYIIFKVL